MATGVARAGNRKKCDAGRNQRDLPLSYPYTIELWQSISRSQLQFLSIHIHTRIFQVGRRECIAAKELKR